MESVEAMSEGEWSSFNGMCSTEEADFMAQLLGNCSLPSEMPHLGSNFGISTTFYHGHNDQSNLNIGGLIEDHLTLYSSDHDTNPSMFGFSQGSNSSAYSLPFPSSSHDQRYYTNTSHHVLMRNHSSLSATYSEETSNGSPDHMLTNNLIHSADEFLNQDASNDSTESAGGNLPEVVFHGNNLQLCLDHDVTMPETSAEDRLKSPSDPSKKRSRIPAGDHGQRSKKNMKVKKSQKAVAAGDSEQHEENNNVGPVLHRQSSSSCLSEDESNFSQEMNGENSGSSSKDASALNLNGKTRASRGSATDPQSLYARKRRERINERLRILQNLVPNGTKVDISTMLEEAVQYVKFLQLQIKLLSSDDLWMYAPIAYNGMDIGLDLKIATPKS